MKRKVGGRVVAMLEGGHFRCERDFITRERHG